MSFPTKPFLLVPCALASLALAACGSGTKPSPSASQDHEQQILNFTRCMREHGVNVSTPNGPGGGPSRFNGTSPQGMEAAQKACPRYRPQGGKGKLTPAERAARQDAGPGSARRMRGRGGGARAGTE